MYFRKTKQKRISRGARKRKTTKTRTRKRQLKAGTKPADIVDVLNKMERGESEFKLPQSNKKIIDSYARKTRKEEYVDDFHKKMAMMDQAYLADLQSRDRYLKDPRNRAHQTRESYFRRPEWVDYHINRKTGKPIQTFKNTHGIEIGLNEEKDGPPEEEDWGFFAHDFRGGKRKTRRRRR